MTFGEMKAKVVDWMREDVDDSLVSDAVNDAIESLYESLMTVVLQQFIGQPVNLTLTAGAERQVLVTLSDPVGYTPTVAPLAVGALPARNLNFKITFVTSSGSETLPSAATLIALAANRIAQIASPPTNAGGNDYSTAYGYNIYAQDPAWGAAYYRVNTDPIPIGTPWQELDGGVFSIGVDGTSNQQLPEGMPLAPSANNTGDNIAFIEHLEVQMPSGEWRAWNQADIDSVVMRRFSASLAATNSPYGGYAWDLLGNNVVEVRPALGATFTPRYFPVIRPRRLAFDGATVPFTNMPCEAFLRYFAIGLLKLADEEYQAASAWGAKADQERGRLLQTAAKTTVKRNNRVTPYMY